MPRIWQISSPHSTPPRRRTRRRALWAALALLALGFVAILLVAFGRFPQQRLTGLIETRAKQTLGEQSRIGRMRVVPARLEAEVWDSVVAGPGYRVELPKARFVFTLGALFGGNLVLQKLELDSPRVVIDALGGAGGAKGRPLTVVDLRVTHGSLLYKNLAGGDLLLEEVDGSGSIGQGVLDLKARSGEWRRPVLVPLGPLHARIALTPRLEARLESLDAATGASKIHMSGAIGPLADPVLDLAFEADLDLRDAERLGGPSATTGRVHTKGRISGSPKSLRVEAHGTSPRVDLGDLTLQAVGADLELGGDTRKTLHLASRIGATVHDQWGGVLRGNATISGGYTPRDGRSDLRWRAALERRRAGSERVLGPGFVSARAEGTASGAAGTPLRIEGRLSGEVLSPSASGLLKVPFTGSFVSQGRRLSADLEMWQAPGWLRASLDADAGVLRRLALRGQDLDLAPLLGAGGRATLQADLRGAPRRASGTAVVKVQALSYRGASLGDADLRLALRNGSGPLQLWLPALNVRGSGELRLAGAGSLRGSLALERTPLGPLSAALGGAPRPFAGELSGVADVTASLAALRHAEVRLRASELKLASGDFQARAGPFTAIARDGIAQLQGLALELPGGRVEAFGRVALTAGSNDLVLRVAADLADVTVPPGWHLQGRATGQLRMTGSFNRPWLVGNVELTEAVLRRGVRFRIVELPRALFLAQGDRLLFSDVTAGLAGGSLKSGGEIPLWVVVPALFPPGDLPRPAHFAAEWRDVRADVLSRLLGFRGEHVLEAPLAGHMVLTGTRASLADLRGDLILEPINGTAAGVAFEADKMAVKVEHGVATLESFSVKTGGQTIAGSARLEAASGALQATARGNVDLRALSPLTSPVFLSGNAGVDVRVAGTLTDPRPTGTITLERAAARSAEFAQALTELQGRLVLEPGLWRVEEVTGRFGGGPVKLAGSARPAGPGTWSDVNLAITAQDVALRYPADFKSRVAADLELVGQSGALRLLGDVLVDGGLYDTDIFLDRALLATDESLLRPPGSPLVEPLAALRAIGLDVQARFVNPFLIRNNLAKLALFGQLRVRGDLAEPAPYGRLEIAEGGLVFLQTRTFTVEGGSLSYEGTLEPTVSVRAQGVIRQPGQEDVAVTVAASGPLDRPHLSLSSDPPYTEREIASLVATGRRNVALDSSSWVAVPGEQFAALLAGRLTRNVQRGLLDLGLDEVDIQPELLARETNPGARFTFGKNITPNMKLIFSRGLKDPEATFYQLEYRMRALADVTARVQSDDHGSITYGLGQRFRWGAPSKPKSGLLQEKRVTLKAVTFSGDKPLPEQALRGAIKVRPGDEVTPWEIQDDADRVERVLIEADHLEALVSARIEDDAAVFAISAGPRFRWETSGLAAPAALDATIRESRFEGEALERGRRLVLEQARAAGYGRAKVEALAQDGGGWRTLTFKVELGAPVRLSVRFPGARGLPEPRLIAAAGGAEEFLTAPERARRLVVREYRAALYLTARLGDFEVTESPDKSSVSILVPVQEGAKAKIARVRFEGASTQESVLRPLTGIAPGSDYAEDKVLLAVQKIREYYLKSGFASARLRHRLVPAAPDVELVFQVSEGQRDTIGPVVVTGLRRTRESMVRSRIDFKAGEPLDPRRLVELERRLLELGVFSRVAVSATGGNPSTIQVEVEERGPYAINYDLRFSQDERATALVDGEIGNLGGLGIVLGGRYRQGLDLREARGSLVLPALGRARGITLSAFDREGDVGPTGEPRRRTSVGPFERRSERGVGMLHSLQLRNKWEAVYSYTAKRVGTTAGGGLQKNLGVLDASIVADTRDAPLNPTRGRFWSVNVGVAPKALGSQLQFARAYGQISLTQPVARSLTWAHGYRVGVASVLRGKTLEEIRLIGRAEGFRAGGGSSVRGYATDSLGPKDLLPGTAAGDAVVIVNQELRYQLPAGFGAAAFYDAGNVFARNEDLSLKLRHSVGVGVRYLSPYGLVRLDVGFPIGRRPGEQAYQVFFGLGQAF